MQKKYADSSVFRAERDYQDQIYTGHILDAFSTSSRAAFHCNCVAAPDWLIFTSWLLHFRYDSWDRLRVVCTISQIIGWEAWNFRKKEPLMWALGEGPRVFSYTLGVLLVFLIPPLHLTFMLSLSSWRWKTLFQFGPVLANDKSQLVVSKSSKWISQS